LDVMEQTLRIGEVASRVGLATSAIRYYESLEILPTPERTASGYRGYTEFDLDLVRFVARLRALKFPLSDVREIVALRRDGMAPCDAVRSTISREAEAIEARIVDLRRLQSELRTLEDAVKGLPDNWPTVCVCNVVADSTPTRKEAS
jgi:DNA-binding transcriptional MerR regulator